MGNFLKSGLLICTSLWLLGSGVSCNLPSKYDIVISNGTVYDGTGDAPMRRDVAILGDTIAALAPPGTLRGRMQIDAEGMSVAPGFINMLSWANESLIQDGKSQSDIRQGVTLEIFGEGESMGPLNDAMKKEMREEQRDIKYEIKWTTLGEYLEYLEKRGISTNVASFVGATTVRIHELGHVNRAPAPIELEHMEDLVREAMEEGALGVGSSLIYTPAYFAKTAELVALCKVAAAFDGIYITHLRSEGNRVLDAVEEMLTISKEAGIPAEIYHLKVAGKGNWPKLDEVVWKVESARAQGMAITADMYLYTAAATGLDALMPPWVQEGGLDRWRKRLQNPPIRKRVASEMSTPADGWENFFLAAGSPDNILLVGFREDSLKYLTGKTLMQVASLRGTTPQETAMDLVVQDGSRVEAIYFLMSEENIRKELRLPWVSFGSDAGSLSPEGVFLKSKTHPRAYGNVARLLGKYVRDEKILKPAEAIRRLTSFPASTLKLKKRGLLVPGYFADIVVFDAGAFRDHATYDTPHQYATGMQHVFVNGVPVLKNGKHTGAKPGRVVRGPGWRPASGTR